MVNEDMIKRAEIFDGLNEEELREIAKICDIEEAKKGTLLCQDGAPAKKLYILEHGKVTIKFKSGYAFDISIPGQIIGWSALINPHRFKADAICEEDSHLISMSGHALLELGRKTKNIGFVVMNNLSGVVFRRLQNLVQYY
jgi:signal-transduction protein with cAMP-binding, CBS, and nucleotidyltransferase domain